MGKKGKPLEQAVKIIQKALKDKPNTKVLVNEYLINVAGEKREFDVVIIHQENGNEKIVAIECKEYKNKVPVKEVEAYFGKCYRVPQIDKKIMVSVKGFQSGAISAAKDFGIDIYTLDELNVSEVINWAMEVINKVIPVTLRFFFRKLVFVTEDYTQEVNPYLFGVTNPQITYLISDYVLQGLYPVLHELRENQTVEVTIPFEGKTPLKSLNDSSKDSILKEIIIWFVPTKELIDYILKIEEFKKHNAQDSTAQIVTQEAADGTSSKFVITDDDITLFHGNPRTGDFHDTGFKFKKED